MANSPVGAAQADAGSAAAPEGEAGADLVAVMQARYAAAYAREEENIRQGYEDLSFIAGDQWPEDAKAKREAEGRPCLTINRLPQFCRQITGDIRQMRPAIKCTPVDGRGDVKTAEAVQDVVRYVENRSKARSIYFKAADAQVRSGMGAWRVTTEYAGDATYAQEVRIASIEDPLAILWDPDAIEQTRSDATFCFVPVDLSRDAFKAKYPDAASEGVSHEDHKNFQGWYGEDYVRVAEYWFKEPAKAAFFITPEGEAHPIEDDEDEALADELVARLAGEGARIEEREISRVMRAVVSATEVLEEPVAWPGRHIPIVPVVGEEVRIGRKIVRAGAVRHARDPQRLYNYSRSAQVEVIALQPKAPFLVTDENVADYEDEWEDANTSNRAYLRYKADRANGGARPERVAPPVASEALHENVALSAEDIKAVTGIYDASLGAKSNEQSGKAILARQREGDTGSYVYIENFTQAVERTGEIIVDLIPHIYDTHRVLRIIGDDGRVDEVEINKPQGVEVEGVGEVLNDVTIGAYDVSIEMGPSYASKRDEAKEGMTAFIQAVPDAAAIMVDLLAKAQDWPLADEIAERLELLLPPEVQALKAKRDGKEPPPPKPNPAAEAEAAAQDLERQKLALEHEKLGVEKMKLEVEAMRIRADAHAAERTEAAAAVPEPPPSEGEGEDAGAAVLEMGRLQLEQGQAILQALAGLAGAITQVRDALAPPAPSAPPVEAPALV